MRGVAGWTVFVAALLGSSALASGAETFNRVASFPVLSNLPDGMDRKKATSAEIITVTRTA